ncbi:PREDICTED: 3-oxoacyl-[acyl-carrier-protein] reductase FabG-like [Priapulus caudatus]|uniref:3-oxoacyl-[acyl-carrier-protein] reductase FabG-like n=1 Tax=Priapulus caudatus TaxID=37621 RepID=A0ABM1EV79_PRICU|nr:PREDICTED: 3-oxoacyl-[acyl-carrier-protein] reductase FabG-like [Priapulus caudatus]XP_014676100.1 PREDICTED: 3-oxoacyl-[acyl-carrier-protein] reductase FabG-like [Priapulus caudatus]XP_014676101.1 PREDICTED: 3-oxoacyl-[acyl-carrier-protein] reductase FabG-like [Priapulus caudatus]
MLKMPGLSGKVILITGASDGIGRGLATHFSSLGSRLVVNGRNKERLEETKNLCLAQGASHNDVLIATGDISKKDDVDKVIDQTLNYFNGTLDVLINNAGIYSAKLYDSAEFEKIVDTNIKGVTYLTHKAIPHLIKSKGNIITISSTSSLRPGSSMMYSMSKAAQDTMTKCLALNLAPKGVRVNSVSPSVVPTDIFYKAGMCATEEEHKQLMEDMVQIHPLGRVGTLEDISKAVAFLASDDAAFITGVDLPVDGGRVLAK